MSAQPLGAIAVEYSLDGGRTWARSWAFRDSPAVLNTANGNVYVSSRGDLMYRRLVGPSHVAEGES